MNDLERKSSTPADFAPFLLWGSVGSLAAASGFLSAQPFERFGSFEYADEIMAGSLALTTAALFVAGWIAFNKARS